MTEVDALNARYLREDEENQAEVLTALLQTYKGRKWLHTQLAAMGIGRQPFSTNALQMSFNCGQINEGNRLLSEILSHNPDAYVLMLKERSDEHRKRADALNAASALADDD